jgi:tol-pal system protein YbgF
MFRKLVFFLILIALSGCSSTPDRSSELHSKLLNLESRVNSLQHALNQEEQFRAEQFALLSQELDALKDDIPPPESATGQQSVKAEPEQNATRPSEPAARKAAAEEEADQAPQVAASPEARYRKALNTLLSGSASKAQEMFQAFLEDHPESDLAPNATYWLGEAYYVQKRFAQSILFFKDVSNTYPDDPKAADALLKMGYAYANLSQNDNARFYLQRLVEQYPASHSARLARERLQNLP